MSRIAGTAYVKVDGAQYTLSGSLTVSIAKATREGLAGLSGIAGYKETPRVPFIEGEFYATENVSLPALEKITNATITAELANGKVYVLRNAWHSGAIELNAGEGTFTARFEGMEGLEQ